MQRSDFLLPVKPRHHVQQTLLTFGAQGVCIQGPRLRLKPCVQLSTVSVNCLSQLSTVSVNCQLSQSHNCANRTGMNLSTVSCQGTHGMMEKTPFLPRTMMQARQPLQIDASQLNLVESQRQLFKQSACAM